MNILRWATFLPCAIIAYVVVFITWYFVTKFSLGYFIYHVEEGDVVSNILRLISNAPAVYFSAIFGVYVAPSNKKIAERIVLATFILIAILSMLFGNLYYTNSTMSIISSVVIIVTSCFLLFYKKDYNEDVSERV